MNSSESEQSEFDMNTPPDIVNIATMATNWQQCRMTTYSINLDEVDLALLPLRTNDFLKKEHYQFQVIKEHVTEVPELASDTYTCHICALEVPAAFAREHAVSVKHRTNARIASVATQRARALITALPPPLAAQTFTRFCANCTAIVDEDHEKTKEHRVALMHDNLLCELMKAYVGDNDETKEENVGNDRNQGKIQISEKKDDKCIQKGNINSYNDTVTQRIINKALPTADKIDKNVKPMINSETNYKVSEIHNKDVEFNTVNSTNMSTNKSENNPTDNSDLPTTSSWAKRFFQTKDVTENGPSQIKSETTITNRKESMEQKVKHAREPYEKELRKFMDTNNQFQIKEMYHRMHIKINDDTVNVYSDHFHSFHRMYKNGDIECIVCNSTFNEKDSEAHKYSLDHMSSVVKIGDDGEYVRQINEAYSHCILCNQKINNINVVKHKQSNHHILRKSNNVRSNAKAKDASKENNHKTKSNNMNTSDTAVDVNKNPYEEVDGELRCLVCDCRVPKDVRNREDHAKGLRHMNNLKTK